MTEQTNPRGSGSKFAVLLALAVVLLAGLGALVFAFFGMGPSWNAPPEVKAEKNPLPATDETTAAGMMIFEDRCVDCHGEKGNGKGPQAHKLSVEPTNFTDAAIMSRLTDGELFWRISVGRRPMPSFRNRLTEQERWELVSYIRTFAQPSTVHPQ